MYTIVVSLMMVICILLVIVVLIQNSKGGGLATGAAGSQVLGVKRTTDFLEKATWTLGIALVSLALVTKFTITQGVSTDSGSAAYAHCPCLQFY